MIKRETSSVKKQNYKNKIIMTGLKGSGKTSIYKVVFNNVDPEETKPLETNGFEVNNPKINFIGKEGLFFIEVGGKERFRDELLRKSEEHFENLAGLLFVIDSMDESEFSNVLKYYKKLIKIINNFSSSIPIFIFLHKIDLRKSNEKNFQKSSITSFIEEIRNRTYDISNNFILRIYQTSIFDKFTLRKAVFDLISYGLLENVFTNLIGSIFLDESHMTILANYDSINKQTGEEFNNLFTFAKDLGLKISAMFKEEIIKVQFSEPSNLNNKSNEIEFNDLISFQEPKIEELPSKDLEIEFACPMYSDTEPEKFQEIDKRCCEITHGLLAGIMEALDYGHVEPLQTMIRDNETTCKFRAVSYKQNR